MHYSKLFVLIIRVIYFFWSHPGAQVCRPGVSDITKPCIHTQFGNKYDSTIVCFLEDRLTCRTGLICPKKKKKNKSTLVLAQRSKS